MFYDRYVKLCSTKGKSPSAVAIELGIGKSTVSCWKRRGNSPTDAVTQKIADYFGVDISELIEEQKEKPTVKDDGRIGMSEARRQLYEAVDDLTDEQCMKLLGIILEAKKIL